MAAKHRNNKPPRQNRATRFFNFKPKPKPMTKDEKFHEDLHGIPDNKLLEDIRSELSRMCKTGKSFTMHVPAQISDFDMMLSELMRRFKELKENQDAPK